MFKVHTLTHTHAHTHTHVITAQLCPTLCDPVDYSLPGSSVHGILQAIILEWVAISSSRDTHTHTHTCVQQWRIQYRKKALATKH